MANRHFEKPDCLAIAARTVSCEPMVLASVFHVT